MNSNSKGYPAALQAMEDSAERARASLQRNTQETAIEMYQLISQDDAAAMSQ